MVRQDRVSRARFSLYRRERTVLLFPNVRIVPLVHSVAPPTAFPLFHDFHISKLNLLLFFFSFLLVYSNTLTCPRNPHGHFKMLRAYNYEAFLLMHTLNIKIYIDVFPDCIEINGLPSRFILTSRQRRKRHAWH